MLMPCRLGPRKLAKAFLHCLDRAQLSSRIVTPDVIPAKIYGRPRRALRQRTAPSLGNLIGVPEAEDVISELISPNNPGSVLCVDDNPLNLRVCFPPCRGSSTRLTSQIAPHGAFEEQEAPVQASE